MAMNNQNENQQFHNPDGLESAGENHTFIMKGSLKQEGDEVFYGLTWNKSCLKNGTPLSPSYTYRRKLTEPKEVDYSSRENKIAVFSAWLDGEEWQTRPLHISGATWFTHQGRNEGGTPPGFLDGVEYRVKPPEPTKREEGVTVTERHRECADEIRRECDAEYTEVEEIILPIIAKHFPEELPDNSLTPRPEQRKEEDQEGDFSNIPLHPLAKSTEPRKVQLSAKDCPPGSCLAEKGKEHLWFSIDQVMPDFVHTGMRRITYEELMQEEIVILRPGSTQFEPCYKFEEVRE